MTSALVLGACGHRRQLTEARGAVSLDDADLVHGPASGLCATAHCVGRCDLARSSLPLFRSGENVSGRKRSLPENRLLTALPAVDRRRLLAHCDLVPLVAAAILTEPGETERYAFFPIDSFVSLIAPVDGDARLEVGLVGDEGMVGVSLILGVRVSPLRALVQGAGLAWQLDAATLTRELERGRALRRVLGRYAYVLLSQIAQTAACTRFHFVEPRLARWLLMTRDRAHSNRFRITHEFLAHMLGVRRVGVTRAASALQRRQLIRYSRGNLEILDLPGLRAAACSCYTAAKATYASVLGQRH